MVVSSGSLPQLQSWCNNQSLSQRGGMPAKALRLEIGRMPCSRHLREHEHYSKSCPRQTLGYATPRPHHRD
jgi:hypothetical protein